MIRCQRIRGSRYREEAIIRPTIVEDPTNCELNEVKFKSSLKKKRSQVKRRGRCGLRSMPRKTVWWRVQKQEMYALLTLANSLMGWANNIE